MFTFDQPYQSAGMDPADIRGDFWDLTREHGMPPQDVLDRLAAYLSADRLAEFMDDLAMGRL
jgi:uncharacterized protein (DUF433 family)